jgi:hypothetical protein
MRIPTILADRYALAICSGDYNEWIRKNTATDYLTSYMFHAEYEMFEFDLGHTFNYAEMSWLMIPRPFMVERGHDDGVGYDEWVAGEYAKVRYRYDKLGLGDRTTIEFFDGPHTINGKGTFEFLEKHLGPPRTPQPEPAAALPVRWTDHIKIKSLADLDALLDAPVDMSKSGGELELTHAGGLKLKPKTGREYFDLLARGFQAYSNYDITMESWYRSAVGFVPYLRNAIPAKVSHVAGFSLAADPLRDLPIQLGAYLAEEEPFKRAVAEGKTWKEFYPGATVLESAPHRAKLQDDGANVFVDLLAWGDFNKDGIEDILLYVAKSARGGTFRSYTHAVITRLEKDGRLAILEE